MPLIQRRTIQGEPMQIGEREFTPEAQVTWLIKRSATIGMNNIGGWGAGLVNINPTALIERGPGYVRRIPIRYETTRLLLGLAAGAVFVLFLAQIAERLATSKGGSK